MKTLMAFIKPFEAPQRNVKITFKLIFSPCPGSGREGLNPFLKPIYVTLYGLVNVSAIFVKIFWGNAKRCKAFHLSGIKNRCAENFGKFLRKDLHGIAFHITCACQGVRNVSFSVNSSLHLYWKESEMISCEFSIIFWVNYFLNTFE